MKWVLDFGLALGSYFQQLIYIYTLVYIYMYKSIYVYINIPIIKFN
jgi:hypothetical protein